MSAKSSEQRSEYISSEKRNRKIYSNQLKEWVFHLVLDVDKRQAKPPLPPTFDSSGVDLSLTEFHQPWCWVLLIWRTLRSFLGNLDPKHLEKVDFCGFFRFREMGLGPRKFQGLVHLGLVKYDDIIWPDFFIKKKKCKAYELARNQIRTMGSQENRS